MQTKTTRDTMGVALMNMKKQSTLAKVEYLKDVQFEDPLYYTAKNIPASGYYLKDEDREDARGFFPGQREVAHAERFPETTVILR